MKAVVVKYGVIAGVVLAALMSISVSMCINGTIDFEYGLLIGYSSMVLAFLAVFFGVRHYRDHQGGTITFGRAFKVGILIALVGCAFYVVGWEIVYWGFIPDFEDKYAAISTQKLRESGADAAKIAAHEAEMAQFKRLYKNPLYNVMMTFMEVFPVALIMSLVSAGILRKTTPDGRSPAVAAA